MVYWPIPFLALPECKSKGKQDVDIWKLSRYGDKMGEGGEPEWSLAA